MTIKKIIYIQIIKEFIFYTAIYAIMAKMDFSHVHLDSILSIIPILYSFYLVEVGGSVLLLYLFYLLLNKINRDKHQIYKVLFIFGVLVSDFLVFYFFVHDQKLGIGYFLFRILYSGLILSFYYKISPPKS